jgi:hypothetical protein
MNITILIACGVGTTLPCILLWAGDEHDRLRGRHT